MIVDCPSPLGALRVMRRASGIRAPLCWPARRSEESPTAAGVGPIGTGSGVVFLRPEFASGFGSRPAAWRFGPVSGAMGLRRNVLPGRRSVVLPKRCALPFPPFFATSSPRSVSYQSLGTGSHAGLMGFMAWCIPVGARFVFVFPDEETGFRPPTQSAAGRGPSGRPPTKRPPARSCSVQPVCLPARMPSAKSDPAVVVSATSSRSPQ